MKTTKSAQKQLRFARGYFVYQSTLYTPAILWALLVKKLFGKEFLKDLSMLFFTLVTFPFSLIFALIFPKTIGASISRAMGRNPILVLTAVPLVMISFAIEVVLAVPSFIVDHASRALIWPFAQLFSLMGIGERARYSNYFSVNYWNSEVYERQVVAEHPQTAELPADTNQPAAFERLDQNMQNAAPIEDEIPTLERNASVLSLYTTPLASRTSAVHEREQAPPAAVENDWENLETTSVGRPNDCSIQ